jgi:hypothetical protein
MYVNLILEAIPTKILRCDDLLRRKLMQQKQPMDVAAYDPKKFYLYFKYINTRHYFLLKNINMVSNFQFVIYIFLRHIFLHLFVYLLSSKSTVYIQ